VARPNLLAHISQQTACRRPVAEIRSKTLALKPLALKLTGPAHGLGSLAGAPFGRFLVVPSELHLAEYALPLHLLLERLQRLIDIVVTHQYLHLAAFSSFCSSGSGQPGARLPARVPEGGRYNTPPSLAKPPPPNNLGSVMAILKIARMGHPVLTRRAEPVADPGSGEIRRLIADMVETMLDAGGVGLAAPQVHVPLRIFVFRVTPERAGSGPEDGPMPITVVVNPEIEILTEERQLRWEGCLSIPGLRGAVPRAPRIRYAGVDCSGRTVGGCASGFHANVVQHEYDHLDGILYPMRMRDFSLFGFSEELARGEPREAGA
jgi:peptide deformylase